MKIRIECKCGNSVEVEPVTVGNIAYFNRDCKDHDFLVDIDRNNYEVGLLQDEVTDPDDVDVKVKEIRLQCRKCGDFMILDVG